jgi:predicted MPP superfamily phosphohydrolase
VIWISDVHLCSVRRSRFAKKIVEISNSLNPDLVFIGGDLFDGTHKPDPALISKPFKDLISKQGIYFIPGNHEELNSPELFFEVIRSYGIKILMDEMVVIDNVQIVGVDYLSTLKKENFKNILNNLNFDKEKITILLKHEPKDLDISEKMGISFQISGHTHQGQQWPLNYLAWIIYKGFSYGLKKYKSMFVYVSSGVGGWGPPLRVGTNHEIVEITFK